MRVNIKSSEEYGVIDFENATPSLEKAKLIWESYLRLINKSKIIDLTKKERKKIIILDIGCGKGMQVNYLREEGYNAFGVDKKLPVEETTYLKKESIYTIVKEIEEFIGTIDIIISNHIFDEEEYEIQQNHSINRALFDFILAHSILYVGNEPNFERVGILPGGRLKEQNFSSFGDKRILCSNH